MKSVLDRLEQLAAYDGPWAPLRGETPLLRERLAELRVREERLDDLLVIALVGGSGAGKSTLLNALAGDELAQTSEFRPCTSVPTVYQPPGTTLPFEEWNVVTGSALERLVIVDTPDSDTVVREHRDTVIRALGLCDVILICGSAEKYLDEATWSLLRPLQGQRTMVCIETKATPHTPSVREHWESRMKEQGFATEEYFCLNALRALDRKLTGRQPDESEYDFPRLEAYLREEFTAEQNRRIKRSNALGLLRKTVGTLQERVGQAAPALESLEAAFKEVRAAVLKETRDAVTARLFSEPHLWTYALGREVSLRAKGLIGLLFRLLEAVRTLPVRFAGWLPRGQSLGLLAAGLLRGKRVADDEPAAGLGDALTGSVSACYTAQHSTLALAMTKAGFDAIDAEEGRAAFGRQVEQRVAEVLEGPARREVTVRARCIASWPVSLLLDALPVAFIGYAAYKVVTDYFDGRVLPQGYFAHTAAVLAIVVGVELALVSLVTRWAAWRARKAATRSLWTRLADADLVFGPEKRAFEEAVDLAKTLDALKIP